LVTGKNKKKPTWGCHALALRNPRLAVQVVIHVHTCAFKNKTQVLFFEEEEEEEEEDLCN